MCIRDRKPGTGAPEKLVGADEPPSGDALPVDLGPLKGAGGRSGEVDEYLPNGDGVDGFTLHGGDDGGGGAGKDGLDDSGGLGEASGCAATCFSIRLAR